MTYDQWFRSQQVISYEGSYLFAEAAWDHQQKRINELEAELAKYRGAPVVGCATTNEEGDLAMLFFDEQEARKYSGDDEPIKLIVKPGEEK